VSGHPLWLRAFWAIHRVLDRLSGGRLGAKVLGISSLWLTSVGRTDYASYEERTTRAIPVVILEPRTAG